MVLSLERIKGDRPRVCHSFPFSFLPLSSRSIPFPSPFPFIFPPFASLCPSFMASGTAIELRPLDHRRSRYSRLQSSPENDAPDDPDNVDSTLPHEAASGQSGHGRSPYGAMRMSPQKDISVVLWFRQLYILTKTNFILTVRSLC